MGNILLNSRNAFLCAVAGLLLMTALPVNAQTPADLQRANQESQRIQREQQIRQQEDIGRSLDNRRPPTQLEMPLPPKPRGRGDGCHDIYRIRITGALNMPDSEKEAIVARYAGKCLGVEEIQSILSQMTAYYIDHGFATSRVYLPAQDLTTGTLHIEVMEGRLSDIQYQQGDTQSFSLATAFPGMTGDVLNLRDFEQGLDQINRLSSNNATLDIAPGAQAGESVVVIRNNPTQRWHGNATYDNYGTRSTGRRQMAGTFSYDDLLGINDFISFTKRETLPYHKRGRHSSSSNLLISVPYGYTTLTGGWAYSEYDSTLVTANGMRLLLEGDNRSIFATVDHVLYRDQVNKLTISGTLTEKEARNYIEKQKLAVSSRQLAVLDLGATYSTTVLGGSGSLGLGYSRGLKILGALQDTPGQDGDLPKAQFEKYTLNASWFRPFTVLDQSLTWSSQLTAQAARDTLFGSEQISAGGIYTVRGFHEESMANDDGYYIRNDLTLRKTLGQVMGADVLFNPYLALDAGAVTGRAPGTPHGTLVGGAVGFGMTAGPINVNVFAGHPIVKPDDMNDEGFTTFGRLSVSF